MARAILAAMPGVVISVAGIGIVVGSNYGLALLGNPQALWFCQLLGLI